MLSQDLEAKIVVLGAQGVGKTSLLNRFIHNTFLPPSACPPTIGATFLTKRLTSPSDHPASTVRLQIWDTAGQERFRSISKLYYRGANAAILCYDITDERSFAEIGTWLRELREYNSGLDTGVGGAWGDGCVVHVVGTKADIVAEDAHRREVPFERCITYVAEQLHSSGGASNGNGPTSPTQPPSLSSVTSASSTTRGGSPSPTSTFSATNTNPRNSGIWGLTGSAASSEENNAIWDSCHEISAKDGEGVEEVFRVIVRKLVEQKQRRDRRDAEMAALVAAGVTPGLESFKGNGGYFDIVAGTWKMADEVGDGRASFRLGKGDKRRSWLMSFPTAGNGVGIAEAEALASGETKKGGRCC